MKRDRKALERVGAALYGPLWQTPLAAALGVSDRTVRRWCNEGYDVPAEQWPAIARLCRQHGAQLQALADRLEAG